MTEELVTLKVKTLDFEPGETKPINVVLGGKNYTAYCPNDFEFAILMKQVGSIERDPLSVDFEGLLDAFFTPSDAAAISRRCKGKPPEIDFIREVGPTFLALVEHYEPDVEARGKALEAANKAQKKG